MTWSMEHLRKVLPDAQFIGNFDCVNQWVLDTRKIKSGDGFLAFVGKKVDGHDFVQKAADLGASVVMLSKKQDVDIPQIVVSDVQQALWLMAAYLRKIRTEVRYIAVTGSAGKSSTRSIMHTAYCVHHRVYSSSGNYNNHLGMPLSLVNMGLTKPYELAIFEMGMNHASEITPMSYLLQPTAAVILNIAPVHIEFFNGLDGIARAKAEIFLGLIPKGIALYPSGEFEDIFHSTIPKYAKAVSLSQYYAFSDEDIRYVGTHSARYVFSDMHKFVRFQQNIVAMLSVYEALFGHQKEHVKSMLNALTHWQPEAGRGLCLEFNYPEGGRITVMDDTYNASELSMVSMLKELAKQQGRRKVLILGDMKELGEYSTQAHQNVARAVMETQIDRVVLVGESFIEHFQRSRYDVQHYSSVHALVLDLNLLVQEGDFVALKGAQSMGLSAVIQTFKQRFVQRA